MREPQTGNIVTAVIQLRKDDSGSVFRRVVTIAAR